MAKGTRRKKGRPRGATARANAELGAHLASLGLAAIEAYKVWCRQHGFSAALSKTWQERRQERVTRPTSATNGPPKPDYAMKGRSAVKFPKRLQRPYRELLARSGAVLRQWIDAEELGRTKQVF